jgi:hypothetical protein
MRRTRARPTWILAVGITAGMLCTGFLSAQQEPIESKIVEAVKMKRLGATEFSIINVIPKFLDGNLYTVGFTGADGGKYENYVHVYDDNVSVYANVYDLLQAIGKSRPPKSILDSILEPRGVSGIIAVLLTITICFNALLKRDIPQILGNALAIILGFYFGAQLPKP